MPLAYQIEWPDLPRGVVICDATAAAAPFWNGPMLSILEAFLALPPLLQPEIVFLGGASASPLSAVLTAVQNQGESFRELNRGAFLGPWLARQQQPRPTLLVTLAGTEILDFEDWQTPAWQGHLAVYRLLGDDRISPAGFTEWAPETPLETLCSFLLDQIEELTVDGAGGTLLDWDQGSPSRDHTQLVITQPRGIPKVVYEHPEELPPRAMLRRRSGEQVAAVMTCLGASDPWPVHPLQHVDTVLSLWTRGVAWVCRQCGESHPLGVSRCANGQGQLLPGLPAGRLVILQGENERWRVTIPPRDVIRLEDGSTILRDEYGVLRIDTDGVAHRCVACFQRTSDRGFVVWT